MYVFAASDYFRNPSFSEQVGKKEEEFLRSRRRRRRRRRRRQRRGRRRRQRRWGKRRCGPTKKQIILPGNKTPKLKSELLSLHLFFPDVNKLFYIILTVIFHFFCNNFSVFLYFDREWWWADSFFATKFNWGRLLCWGKTGKYDFRP